MDTLDISIQPPNHHNPTEAIVWSYLLDTAPWSALWTWLHACNPSGSGVVVFRLADAAKALGRTHQTLRNHLKRGQRSGWFRCVAKAGKGSYRVYLAGILRVARSLDLEHLGPAALVPVDRLRDARRLATDVAAEELQAAARWARVKELRDGEAQHPADRAHRGPNAKGQTKRPSVPSAYELLCPTRQPSQSSESSPGGNGDDRSARAQQTGVIFQGRRNLYLSDRVEVTGVTQEAIARYLGRSLSTIRRRQNNTLRQRLDRPVILKKQAAVLVPCGEHESPAQRLIQIVNAARAGGDPQAIADSRRYFTTNGSLWYACTNLYALEDSHLKRQRQKRAKYKRSKGLSDCCTSLGGGGVAGASATQPI